VIEIKFDSANESGMVQHVKDLLSKNPIVLQNIIEPCVNEMISDQNIPNQIKESIKQGVQLTLTPEVIKTALVDTLPEILEDNGLTNIAEQVIRSEMESNSGPIHDMIQDTISETVSEHISPNDIEEAIADKIDHEVGDLNIGRVLEEQMDSAMEEANIEEKINTAIRDYFRRDVNVEEATNIAVTEFVEHNLGAEAIAAAAKEVILQKFEVFTEAKVIELFKEFLATDPGLKKLIESQIVLPVMEKKTSPGMDILQIGIKPEATASFMWMIKGLMNEKTIEIQKVNGV